MLLIKLFEHLYLTYLFFEGIWSSSYWTEPLYCWHCMLQNQTVGPNPKWKLGSNMSLMSRRALYVLTVLSFEKYSISHEMYSCLGLTGRKHYQKITIPIFRLIHQNFAFPGCFFCILLCHYLFSLLSSGWFVIAVCGSFSIRKLIESYLEL